MYSIYRRTNNLLGLLIFGIAATVYCLTAEPTASFWDCPEFITSAYKLEVGHPPGAPFFMLTANFFTQLTNNPAEAARMVNYMSAIMSGATILFLFWTITHLTRRLICPEFANENMSRAQLIGIMGCGAVGALAYTFSDTFWFNAVEGEVYAYSSLFTALVFWLILKWEEAADEPHSDRWIVLIAYLTGLSIGVHLLNLLCLPAIVLVYYYRKRPDANIRGSLLALFSSMLLVAAVLFVLVPGIVKVGGWFELLFVNSLGLPFNYGLMIYIIMLATSLIWSIYESYSGHSPLRMKLAFLIVAAMLGLPYYGLALFAIWFFVPWVPARFIPSARTLNTSLLCLTMIVIGYSTYALTIIRSAANPPMDQNDPEDIFTLGSYLNREQYGSWPLLYGQAFSSERAIVEKDGYCIYQSTEGSPVYKRKEKESPDEKDSYIVTNHIRSWKYAQNMLFPRMYSADHASIYKQWVDIRGNDVPYDRCGEPTTVNIPTQWENLRFFFSYQLNYMYWRYFLWNFVGRQNDIQGQGEIEHGNWITGFRFIDRYLTGDPNLLPKELKNNKGRNVFYGLPLLLGIIGLLWQSRKGKRGIQDFWIVFFLFFMTGIATVLYLNQTPMQVRERDYAYAGSFYAFSIWIGMGVAGIIQFLQQAGIRKRGIIRNELIVSTVVTSLCLCIPIQMASQTWDDHDRSGRYVCRDTGKNYLDSAQKENYPIILNNGDNDTFPLWYNQEVEGVRTDVRPCNFTYLNTDWYIDQMRRPAYNSPALPITWKRSDYQAGTNDVIPIEPKISKQIDAYYQADPERARQDFGDNPYELRNILRYWVQHPNKEMRAIPTDSIVMKLDKEAILSSGMQIPDSLHGEIPEYMHINLKGRRFLTKNELLLLEMVAQSNWKRPIYFTSTIGEDNYVCFKDYVCQEGLLVRITPFNTTALNARMDGEKTYDCLMNRFQWGGIEHPKVYMDKTCRGIYANIRTIFANLAEQLIRKGKTEKALRVLNRCLQVIPDYGLPYDYSNGSLTLAKCFFLLGQTTKAEQIVRILADKSTEYLAWYKSMSPKQQHISRSEYALHLYLLREELDTMQKFHSTLADKYIKLFEKYYKDI